MPCKSWRSVYRGGNWNNSANGLFSFNGNNDRSNVNSNIGFRSALIYLLRSGTSRGTGSGQTKGVRIHARGSSCQRYIARVGVFAM